MDVGRVTPQDTHRPPLSEVKVRNVGGNALVWNDSVKQLSTVRELQDQVSVQDDKGGGREGGREASQHVACN